MSQRPLHTTKLDLFDSDTAAPAVDTRHSNISTDQDTNTTDTNTNTTNTDTINAGNMETTKTLVVKDERNIHASSSHDAVTPPLDPVNSLTNEASPQALATTSTAAPAMENSESMLQEYRLPDGDLANAKNTLQGIAPPPAPVVTPVETPSADEPIATQESGRPEDFYKRAWQTGARRTTGATTPTPNAPEWTTEDRLKERDKEDDTNDTATISDLTNPTTVALSVSMQPLAVRPVPTHDDAAVSIEPQLFAEALIVGASAAAPTLNMNPIFLSAHAAYPTGSDAVLVRETETAAADENATRKSICSGRTSTLLLAVLIVLLTALVSVGIVCGTGGCVRADTSGDTVDRTDTTTTDRDTAIAIVVTYINSITLSGRVIAAPSGNETRPEEVALAWLVESSADEDLVLETPAQLFRVRQRYALASLLLQSPRDVWSDDTNNATMDNECSWRGVVCQPLDLATDVELVSAVTEVNWGNANWTGVLVPDLGLLTTLVRFDMVANNVYGTLPTALGEWNELTFINLGYNDLTGTFPESIQLWSAIEYAYFYGNELTGTIPGGICSASGLQSLGADCRDGTKVTCPCSFEECICF